MDAENTDRSEAESFAKLALELHDSSGVVDTVDTVVQFALQAVSCQYAGITLAERGRLESVAVTDPRVRELDELQLAHREGPSLDVMAEHESIVIGDLIDETRWPTWSAKAASFGVRSALCLRLYVGGRSVGVLTLYAAKPDAFTRDDVAVAHILARHASVAVATARQQESMAAAIDARKLVGQAMGILMERYDIDGNRAFEVLRRYSQHNNMKLRDVAQQLIDTRELPRYDKPPS